MNKLVLGKSVCMNITKREWDTIAEETSQSVRDQVQNQASNQTWILTQQLNHLVYQQVITEYQYHIKNKLKYT